MKNETKTSAPKRLLAACFLLAAALAAPSRADDADDASTWPSRAPLEATFVNYNAKTTAYGTDVGMVLGNGREGAMLFDVSGLAGVTAAKLRIYATQCGSTAGVVWPVVARVMSNPGWTASTLTWNTLPDEFRTAPSAHLAEDDATVAGRVVIPAGSVNSWQEIDVTEAVKSAAAGSGLLSLHLFTTWGGGSGDNTPLSFASPRNSDATIRPVLAYQGEESFPVASPLVLTTTADTFISGNSAANKNANYGSADNAMLDRLGRESFLKFDLSGVGAASVDSAVLVLRTHSDSTYVQSSAGTPIQFELTPKTDWSESELTWNNAAAQTGLAPGQTWTDTASDGVVRGPAASGADQVYAIDLAPLVNKALAAGEKTLSLHIWRKNNDTARFMTFYTKETSVAANRPRLLVSPSATALATRKPLQETFVSDYSAANKDKSFYNGTYANYVQVGHTGGKVQYATMLFDPSGLEDAEFVRFRVKTRSASLPSGAGIFRAAAWVTDGWSETNLTWNTVGPWFPAPATVEDGVALDGEVASIDLTQTTTYQPYFEADVTAAARAAARAGRMLTIGLFSNTNWPEFWKGGSSNPAVLLFPDPDASFGARVTAAYDESGDAPGLRLMWSPDPAGAAEYTVERSDDAGATWKTVASGLSAATCLDTAVEPWEEHIYRVSAYFENGASASVEKAVTLEPRKKIYACADTYVRNGESWRTTKFGSDTMAVHRYSAGSHDTTTREGFVRFEVSEMPDRFLSATLKLNLTGPAGAPDNASGHFDLFEYPDFEWTDADAPAWDDVFGNGYATSLARSRQPDSKRMAETLLGQWICSESGPLPVAEPVEFDVTDAIRSAKAAGKDHITLHTAVYSTTAWNFGVVTHERAQGVSIAPRIEFALKSWIMKPLVLVVR